MAATDAPMVAEVSLVQPKNAELPTTVTDEGMATEVSLLQF